MLVYKIISLVFDTKTLSLSFDTDFESAGYKFFII